MTQIQQLRAAVTGTSLPRTLVESLVRAVDPKAGPAALARLDAAGSLHWVRGGGVEASVGVDELRTAVSGLDGLDGARKARLDAVLQLVDTGPHLTTGQAATRMGIVDSRNRMGVREALQSKNLDVVIAPSQSGARVQRVPAAFLAARSAEELLARVVPAAGVRASAPVAEAAASVAGLFGAIPSRARSVIVGGAGLTAAAGLGLALRGPIQARSAETASAPSAPPVAPTAAEVARQAFDAKIAGEVSAGIAAASRTQDPDRLAAETTTRLAMAKTAMDLIGTSDLLADGSVNPTVRAMKAATLDGDPDNAAAIWPVAFATHVAKAAGAPIGKDGKGAATALDLRIWAEESGRFRAPDDASARIPGNLVLLERIDAKGLTYHDVGVITPAADGTGVLAIAGDRLGGASVEVGGTKTYLGTVGSIDDRPVPFDADLKKDGIRIEGYIDPISTPLPVAPKPVIADPKVEENRKRAEIVARAASKVGVMEVGRTNRSKEVDEFWMSSGGNGAAGSSERLWCAAFTSWVFNEQRMPYVDRDGATGTWQIRNWAIDNNVWHERSSAYEPRPGDLIGFKVSERGDPNINHIGIVKSYDPTTRMITTIEGNTSGGPGVDSNGGGVYERQRHRDAKQNGVEVVRGFVNVFDYYAANPEGPQ